MRLAVGVGTLLFTVFSLVSLSALSEPVARAVGEPSNIALGKKVASVVPESPQYARPAAHLTDGNLKTDAYPGAFALAYTVDLTAYSEAGDLPAVSGYDVESITIEWGKFGRHFPGVMREDGTWARAAYEADYVNRYSLSYQRAGDQSWHPLHSCASLPTVEDAQNVSVVRSPADSSPNEGDVTTHLSALDLRGVTAIRIEGSGGHWIGVYELKVFGTPSAAKPPQARQEVEQPTPANGTNHRIATDTN